MADPTGPVGDWSPAEFERHGVELLHQVRTHFETLRQRPVAPTVDPATLRRLLDRPLPAEPEPFPDVLADTWETVVPNLTLWHHPAFHAYFSNSSSFPAILAETLTAALNVNAMLWQSAPAASAVEEVVLRWMAEMVDYPVDADGVLINGASLATFYALAAARDAVPGLDVREHGLTGRGLPTLRVYASDQAHSSVDKAAIAAGVGTRNVVRVDSDPRYRMDPSALEDAIRRDRAAGHLPLAVVATVGTTATGAVDPLPPIAQVCGEHDVWLHTDAAYGGFWHLVPEAAREVQHLGLSDSLVVNPHKCLFTPLEATAFYSRRRGALAGTFRLVPEYLRTDRGDGADGADGADGGDPTVDFMDRSLQLGRAFRALKVWWVIRSFGRDGLVRRLAHSLELAASLRRRAQEHPDWQVVAPSALPLVCLRYAPPQVGAVGAGGEARADGDPDVGRHLDALNARILAEVNRTGTTFLSHTVVREGYVIRVSIGNIHTTAADVDRLWATLNAVAARCMAAAPEERVRPLA